jgi:exopolysaccharide biosynthesis polyprenyl glycosylphosphotransferase
MTMSMKRPFYAYFLPFADWVTVGASIILAIILRGRTFAGDFTLFGFPLYGEIFFVALYSGVAVLIFEYLNLYKVNVFVTVVDHSMRILKGLFFTVLGIALLSFFIRSEIILDSRLAIIYFTSISFTLMICGRVIVFRGLFLYLSKRRVFQRNALIVGGAETGKNLAVNLLMNDHIGLNVVGFLDDGLSLGKVVFNRIKVIGRIAELKEIVKVYEVHEVIICLEHVEYDQLIRTLEVATGTDAVVKISSPLYDVVPSRLFIEKYGNVPVVSISHVSPSPRLEVYKRIFDSVMVGAGILCLLPLFAALSFLIKLDSRGPIFFTQTRIGKNGRPFRFYKFRSMQVGSDRDDTRAQTAVEFIKSKKKNGGHVNGSTKIVNEARITRIGRWLRKTSLDELPQLINVMKGEMSLVGPRPCLPYEWENYEDWHKRRLSVMPGCTGMWQVAGRSVVGFEDMVILDLYYIQNASLMLDFTLLLRTFPVMLFGAGAK